MNVFPTSQEQGFRNCARLKNDDVARSFRLNKKTPDSPVPIDFLSFYIQTPCDILFSTKLLMGGSIEKKSNHSEQALASFTESFHW